MAEHNKKSEHHVLFPTETGTNLSHVFEVTNKPVVLKAFNLPDGVDIVLEMGAEYECETIWGPFKPHCCLVKLNSHRNVMVLGLSGKYRMFIHNPNHDDVEDVILVQHKADVFEPVPDFCECEEVQ